MPKRLIVLGAGAMGLAAAYRALKLGMKDVTILEADHQPGGMAAHFDFGGVSLERFYHFICKADQPTFDLMEELGISDKLRWRRTRMGYYTDGELHPWGDPLSLLRFPQMGLIDKIRYGAMAFATTKRKNFASLEKVNARRWLEEWLGESAYKQMWEPLFRLKFYEYADDISAAWIATRIKRVGTSRRSILAEELGFIEGGSETLVNALVNAIEKKGGAVRCGDPAAEILSDGTKVTGVRLKSGEILNADAVVSTVPTPYVADLAPSLPEDWLAQYQEIHNIPVVCIVMKLAKPVSENFWVNITDPDIEIPGIVEFSNLRPLPEPIVYVPYYMPASHSKWTWTDQQFIDEAWGYLQKLNPTLAKTDLIEARVGRLRHAQPVCEAGFQEKIPTIETPIEGLQIADTCFYYPEDRGIAESVRVGAGMAEKAAA